MAYVVPVAAVSSRPSVQYIQYASPYNSTVLVQRSYPYRSRYPYYNPYYSPGTIYSPRSTTVSILHCLNFVQLCYWLEYIYIYLILHISEYIFILMQTQSFYCSRICLIKEIHILSILLYILSLPFYYMVFILKTY